MRKKAKAIAITRTKVETKNTLLSLLLLAMIFGILLYFHSFMPEISPEWIGVLDQSDLQEKMMVN